MQVADGIVGAVVVATLLEESDERAEQPLARPRPAVADRRCMDLAAEATAPRRRPQAPPFAMTDDKVQSPDGRAIERAVKAGPVGRRVCS